VDAQKWSEWIGSRLFPRDRDWQQEFNKRFAIIDDKSLSTLARFGTEVNAHVKISGIPEPWNPARFGTRNPCRRNRIDFSVPHRGPQRLRFQRRWKTRSHCRRSVLQMGGKATTGQGLVRLAPAGGAQ